MSIATAEPRLRTSEAVDTFLHRLGGMDDQGFVTNVPGMRGPWRVMHLREALKMNALCVHHSGEVMAATEGRAFDHWMQRVMDYSHQGPTSLRMAARVTKPMASPKPDVATPKDGDQMVGADPWRFD